jgi:hypothetical protein
VDEDEERKNKKLSKNLKRGNQIPLFFVWRVTRPV